MNIYFLILWILPSGFGWNWCQNWRFILSAMCANDRNFRVSTRPLRPFLVLFVTTFEQKHRFLRVHFEVVIPIFWTIWTIYLCNVGVSFWFYPVEIHFFWEGFSHFSKFRSKIKNMTCYLSEPGVEFEISTFFVNIFKYRSKFKKMKKPLPDNFILFLKINESHFLIKPNFCYAVQEKLDGYHGHWWISRKPHNCTKICGHHWIHLFFSDSRNVYFCTFLRKSS